jgi:hypothetical protein
LKSSFYSEDMAVESVRSIVCSSSAKFIFFCMGKKRGVCRALKRTYFNQGREGSLLLLVTMSEIEFLLLVKIKKLLIKFLAVTLKASRKTT